TRSGSQFGVHASLDKIDLAEVTGYADGVVGRLYKGLTGLVAARQITVVAGEGRLIRGAPVPAVAVGDQVLQGRQLVLATGAASKTLPGVEVDGVRVLSSDSAIRLQTLPTSAIVLGGGVIGCEFASAWRSFGVEVTVLEALDRLLPSEEPESSAALHRAFRKRGIVVATGVRVESCQTSPEGVRVSLANGSTRTADVVLVAVGRGPASAGLGLPEAGIELERGWVVVDERLATGRPGVYAVGDLVAGLQLAHRGFAHGIFAAEEVAAGAGRLDRPPAPVRDRDIPRVTYSDPEVASVGLGEEAARAAYGAVETAVYDLTGNGRSQILKTSGFVKLVRVADGPVVGVHLVGSRVSELISEAQLITAWEAFPAEVAGLLHPHPTQSEAIGEAHLALAGKPLHSHH
ncbi:MAG: dihydrolipoyl dehydrogenase, partial [Actinomycetes bacterium]